jgi:hypothetical protein
MQRNMATIHKTTHEDEAAAAAINKATNTAE